MVEYDKGGGRRLLVGYTDDRAKKDAYNREKGIRRLEKAYKHGALTKGNINKRCYNKFLSMDGEVKVTINYDRVAGDSRWDGLKGYLTNTDIPIQEFYAAYHNLWHVERAFRIAKSKIEIRPMFHFTRKRIEAHICICFVALSVQGIGTYAESLRDQDERRQGACIGKDNHNGTDQTSSEQGGLHPNHADDKASENS